MITGANKGIGLETAKQMAELGYYVYIGSRDKQKGMKAVELLKKTGSNNVECIEIDITVIESVKRARMELDSKLEALDILINNAGISGDQPQKFSTGNVEILRKIFNTNFFGPVQTTYEMLPLLEKSKNPVIINVSSEVGSLAIHASAGKDPNLEVWGAYGSSKTALNAFTVMLNNELEDTPFRINSVTPGYTATDLNDHQGTKTVEEGARPIVKVATESDGFTTGKFYGEQGNVPW
ncbi:SDR family NAD(P)-dependent oxidoreductase [Autumnicola edwardsiae]|uniref:SDR family NAD(P)-dependent oxidoreductase n=1 Tax=Autumnicola edwardsiae TaxID=3075594 RepID=A0ABU3CZB7_9FLAO|nr:SDR family NAD(P)-dependent oxidoreductase [Zunongwangia sp. F297]MDT0651713.1 SDR family NAD(P)-dependent oxidoreductase [Zunongwangia sp. F297]